MLPSNINETLDVSDLPPTPPRWRRFLPKWVRELIWLDERVSYDAFISYSWKADAAIAPSIQRAISQFLCPWYKVRAKRVFRDLACLAAGSSLEDELRMRLDASEHLIVLASRAALASEGMELEVRHWYSKKRVGQVLVILTDGDFQSWDDVRPNALPPSLAAKLRDAPLWINLAHRRDEILAGSSDPKLQEKLVEELKQVILRFYPGREWGELRGQERIQRQRALGLLFGTGALLLSLTVTAMWQTRTALISQTREKNQRIAAQRSADLAKAAERSAEASRAQATYQRDRAREAADESRTRLLAAQAQYLSGQVGQLTLASLLALESAIREPLPENRNALSSILTVAGKPHLELQSQSAFSSVAFGKAGWVASANGDNIILWNTVTGREFLRLRHGGRIRVWAISPDGQWILSTGEGRTCVWDTTTGQQRFSLPYGHVGPSMAISPDSKWFVLGGEDEGAHIWDSTTGERLADLHVLDQVSDIGMDRGGKWLAMSVGSVVKVWKRDTITRNQYPDADLDLDHDAFVTGLAITSDGTSIVTTAENGTVRLWDLTTGRERLRASHQGAVTGLAISPDGAWIATSSRDGTARIWDSATLRERLRLVHGSAVTRITLSPDGSMLATAAFGEANVWDSRTGLLLGRFEQRGAGDTSETLRGGSSTLVSVNPGFVTSIAFSPDNHWMVTAGGLKTAVIWDLKVMGRGRAHLVHQGKVNVVATSPDDKWIATGCGDHTVHIWDAHTGMERSRMSHDRDVIALAIAPNSKWLVTGSFDSSARIWDARTGREIARLSPGGLDSIASVAVSPDGKVIGTASYGLYVRPSVRLWNVPSWDERARLAANVVADTLAISPDGKWLATGDHNKNLRIWDFTSGRERIAIHTHQSVDLIAIAPQSTWLATASRDRGVDADRKPINDNTVTLWDGRTGVARLRLKHEDSVRAIAINPAGTWLATASSDRTARVWDAATGQELARLEHQNVVNSVAISADGKWIATASADRTARIWDPSGREVMRFEYEEGVTRAYFQRESRQLVVAHGNEVSIEDWRTEDFIFNLCARMTRNLTHEEWLQYVGDSSYRRTCVALPDPDQPTKAK